MTLVALTETGDQTFEPLERIRTPRRRQVRPLSLVQRLPAAGEHDGGVITVRLQGNDDDTTNTFNRTKNGRAIPPGYP